MRRGSVVGPVILIAIGVLFLINNLRPELSLGGILMRSWPFLLIGWGTLRLIEILFWAVRGKPLPVTGISGGEWATIVMVTMVGSATFFATERARWSPFNFKMRGIEMLGEAYDYPVPEKAVAANGKNPRIVIENVRGNARINGADVTEVRMAGRKTVRAMSREDADRAGSEGSFEVVMEGETIFVRQTGNRWGADDRFVTTDIDVTVPRGSHIEARGRRGDFDVTDVTGDVEIHSDNAGVRLLNIGGDVRVNLKNSDVFRAVGVKGGVDLKGSGHDVELENIAGEVVVAGSFFGDLQFRGVEKPVRFEGGQKTRGTEWRVEACPGQIRMNRGNLSLENVTGPVQVAAKSKDVQISDFTQSLDLQVDRGDLDIRTGLSPAPRMSVSTNAGNLELTLPENGRFSLKGKVDKGEVENDFGESLAVREEGRGASISGAPGDGPQVTVRSGRGAVRVRKGPIAEALQALPVVKLPRKAIPVDAEKALVLERN